MCVNLIYRSESQVSQLGYSVIVDEDISLARKKREPSSDAEKQGMSHSKRGLRISNHHVLFQRNEDTKDPEQPAVTEESESAISAASLRLTSFSLFGCADRQTY